MRTEFERHRYVSQLPVVDMLLFQSHAEYQVLYNLRLGLLVPHEWSSVGLGPYSRRLTHHYLQETLNYWKQLPHVLKYFRPEDDPNAKLPQNFMTGFLEVCDMA